MTACERPLGSNQSEQAEQAADATAVAETAQGESSVESANEAEVGSAAESGPTAEAESSAETAAEAESSDENVGGGTPDTAASEAAEQATAGEETTAEVTSGEAATETGGEAAQEDATTEESTTGEAATADAETAETTSAEGEAEATTAAEESAAATTTTLPATHTVAAGENLYRIGLKYGLSWVVLAAYNYLPNANYIRVGQVLQIPGGGTPGPTPTPVPDGQGHIDYVVQRGDTLNKIGQKYGVTWVAIAEANGLVNPNLIYAGQVLKIPTTEPEMPPAVTYTVVRGDTLSRISLLYGVHWLAIAQANNIAPPYIIYPGQVLAIPGG